MDIKLEVSENEMQHVQLELLIKTVAGNTALATVIVEMLAKTPDEEEEFINRYWDLRNLHAKELFNDLFERKARVDINEIILPPLKK